MNLEFDMKLCQEQKMVITPQMQLSLKLLQMSSYDLRVYVDNEFAENPLLDANFDMWEEENNKDKLQYNEMIKYLKFDNYEKRENYDDYFKGQVSPLDFISEKMSLSNYLYEQLIGRGESQYIKNITMYLIDNLDHRGYMDIPLESISKELEVDSELIVQALGMLQELEPVGIGARSIEECLKIQLEKKRLLDVNIKKIIDNYLDAVANNRYKFIAKEIDITILESQNYIDIIRNLEPKPSRGFYTGDETKFIVYDAEIMKSNGEYYVKLNEELLPKLEVSKVYRDMVIDTGVGKETEQYVKEKLSRALFLIKSIEERKSTLLKVLEKVVEKQKEYFEYGERYLKPMTLNDIAEELAIHQSTVSRAINEKHISTGWGVIKVKSLFTAKIKGGSKNNEDSTALQIKNEIIDIINAEDKNNPLSDGDICEKLSETQMNISRRTVAKYRQELDIKASYRRKRIIS